MNLSPIRRLAPLAALAAIALTACADDGPSTAPVPGAVAETPAPANGPGADQDAAAEPVVVEIARSRFGTPELRVPAGTTVEFVNRDEFAHTVTAADDSPRAFDSGLFGQDETFAITFDEPGEHPYFCAVHPTMRATVIVE